MAEDKSGNGKGPGGVARPLKVLIPLIREEVELGRKAGLEDAAVAKLREKAKKACAKLGATLRVWPPKTGLVAALRGQTGLVPVRCTLPPGVRFVAKHELLSNPHRLHVTGGPLAVWEFTCGILKQGTRDCRCLECREGLADLKSRARSTAKRYARMLRDRRANRAAAKSDRRCVVCGKKLSSEARRDRQFCGPACKQKAWRKKKGGKRGIR